LHYISSRSDFCFEFAEIFVIKKRLAESKGRETLAGEGVRGSPFGRGDRHCGALVIYEYSMYFAGKITEKDLLVISYLMRFVMYSPR
jgi:hypothetical protein